MFTILLRNPFVSGGLKSPRTFLRLLHHEIISKPYPTSPSSPKSDLSASFFKTSCGLSPEAALAAGAKLNMKTTANAESVLRLLQNYGFTISNIAIIAAKQPIVFSFHPEKCIKPKLDLFLSAGLTENFIHKLFSKEPYILISSLEKKLSPNLNMLMTILGGDRKAFAASILGSTWIITLDLKKHMLPNMKTLREHGIPRTNIAKLVVWCPRAFTKVSDQFSKFVMLIVNMGFDPTKISFIQGIKVIQGLAPTTWERKLQIFRSLGWSHEETISAFKKFPYCMGMSEEKVRKIMTFFVENLKWKPSRLAMIPVVLGYSFEKRIVPRYAIFNILSTNGLLERTINFSSFLSISESIFLKKYVCKYSDIVPELLEAYKVKLDMAVAVPSNYVI